MSPEVSRRRCGHPAVRLLVCIAIARHDLCAQALSQRGYLETLFTAYPQTAPGDSGRLVAETVLRYEPAVRFSGALSLHGSVDARADTHRQVERRFRPTFWDRTLRRPTLAVRRLSIVYTRGPATLELGKQFVRWGKVDILNPTDRFAPRDYLSVSDTDVLAVTAARMTIASATNSLEAVVTPRLTPSRMPLVNQRWVALPPTTGNLPIADTGAVHPGGPQFGGRWNRIGARLEHSLSYFDGFHHLARLDATLTLQPPELRLLRSFPRIRSAGGDVVLPLPWFSVKGESAWIGSKDGRLDDYLLYVVQLERQWREWLFVTGYAGEVVTARRHALVFAPDRGLARAFVARASVTIGANRSLVLESVARQDGKGFLGRVEYSHPVGAHWRATARVSAVRGSPDDFLGQYRRNSSASLALRYSF